MSCVSNNHLPLSYRLEIIRRLNEEQSLRKIASDMNIGKNTVESIKKQKG